MYNKQASNRIMVVGSFRLKVVRENNGNHLEWIYTKYGDKSFYTQRYFVGSNAHIYQRVMCK